MRHMRRQMFDTSQMPVIAPATSLHQDPELEAAQVKPTVAESTGMVATHAPAGWHDWPDGHEDARKGTQVLRQTAAPPAPSSTQRNPVPQPVVVAVPAHAPPSNAVPTLKQAPRSPVKSNATHVPPVHPPLAGEHSR
jgi:hypothetical protein